MSGPTWWLTIGYVLGMIPAALVARRIWRDEKEDLELVPVAAGMFMLLWPFLASIAIPAGILYGMGRLATKEWGTWDRCQYGGHPMWTKSGYTLCRKHGEMENRAGPEANS